MKYLIPAYPKGMDTVLGAQKLELQIKITLSKQLKDSYSNNS